MQGRRRVIQGSAAKKASAVPLSGQTAVESRQSEPTAAQTRVGRAAPGRPCPAAAQAKPEPREARPALG